MKHPLLLVPACALAATLLAPAVAGAAQTPAPTASPSAAMHHHHRRGMHGAFRGITLTPDQRTKMKALRDAYRKAHPMGSPRDPAAMKQLRSDMLNVLTPDQRKQFEANRAHMRAHRRDRNAGGPFSPSNVPSPAPSPTTKP